MVARVTVDRGTPAGRVGGNHSANRATPAARWIGANRRPERPSCSLAIEHDAGLHSDPIAPVSRIDRKWTAKSTISPWPSDLTGDAGARAAGHKGDRTIVGVANENGGRPRRSGTATASGST